jgi:hypothetical protein
VFFKPTCLSLAITWFLTVDPLSRDSENLTITRQYILGGLLRAGMIVAIDYPIYLCSEVRWAERDSQSCASPGNSLN